MKISRRSTIVIAATTAVVVAGVIVGVAANQHAPAAPRAVATQTPTPTPTPTQAPYATPSAAAVAALPEAKYNAVIPGLVALAAGAGLDPASAVDKIAVDAPLYGSDRTKPVARFAAKNFLGQASVIVPVRTDGSWTLVMTPARQTLPSKNPSAPAQSAGWIRTSLLTRVQTLTRHIVVSVGKQTVSIVDDEGTAVSTFSAGVGAAGTATPTGVMGYMEARYLDPAQNQTVYPIGLTSLHSTAADEPYTGHDGGLIGIHYEAVHSGNISHGCVRLDGPSITALDQLPLGTSVLIQK
ncbi:L,D-transpeptidase [Frondihabitans peucedani]|uniref:L,D-TPase catalytic domain-containing protein n=1 Tax=Frondihabitans peucedani TaxID=598626 RepID=A0ABP8E6M2_9MICO